MTSTSLILEILSGGQSMAVHQIAKQAAERGFFYSENNLATRCSELAHEGKIRGEFKKGVHYKVWSLIRKAEQLELLRVA